MAHFFEKESSTYEASLMKFIKIWKFMTIFISA